MAITRKVTQTWVSMQTVEVIMFMNLKLTNLNICQVRNTGKIFCKPSWGLIFFLDLNYFRKEYFTRVKCNKLQCTFRHASVSVLSEIWVADLCVSIYIYTHTHTNTNKHTGIWHVSFLWNYCPHIPPNKMIFCPEPTYYTLLLIR